MTSPARIHSYAPNSCTDDRCSGLKVREVLVSKLQALNQKLKLLLSRIPKMKMEAIALKYQEIEKSLKVKCICVEEVEEQRKYINQLPEVVATIMSEIEEAQVL